MSVKGAATQFWIPRRPFGVRPTLIDPGAGRKERGEPAGVAAKPWVHGYEDWSFFSRRTSQTADASVKAVASVVDPSDVAAPKIPGTMPHSSTGTRSMTIAMASSPTTPDDRDSPSSNRWHMGKKLK